MTVRSKGFPMASSGRALTLALCLLLGAVAGFAWLAHRRSWFQDTPLTTIKIGVLLPLNSDLKAVAEKMRNGMELAREDLLARYPGRLAIEIDYENGCFESEAAPAVQKFIHTGVKIIGGSFCLFGHIPILPLTEAMHIITFNTAANPDVVLHKRYAFSTNVEIQDQAAHMADFAYEVLGRRRVVMMHLDSPFGHDYERYFRRRFEERGGQVLFDIPNAPAGKSYGEFIPRIKAANADLIVTAHFGVPLGLFFKELRAAGIDTQILGNYETEDVDVLDAAGSAAEGVIFVSSELPTPTAAMARFATRYVRKFGVRPDAIVTNSYDDIILAVEASLSCQGDTECMRGALHAVNNYDGASGVITINASGATDKPANFKVIRNRTFIFYEPGVAVQQRESHP